VTAVESSVEQAEIVAAVREFVDRDVIPVASDFDHRDEFPTQLVETMKGLGLFGTTIPEEYGGLGLRLDTYALIMIELSRGWVTLPGIMNDAMKWVLMIPDSEIQPRESSLTISEYVMRSSPRPPYSSGIVVPNSPSSFIVSTSGVGNSSLWS
jgi:hypothetical protein